MRVCYYGVFHKSESGTFGVCFPEVPGCISAGQNLDEAEKNASEGLKIHLESMIEDDEQLPVNLSYSVVWNHEWTVGACAVLPILVTLGD